MYDINRALTTGVIKRIYMRLKELINFIEMKKLYKKLNDKYYNDKKFRKVFFVILFIMGIINLYLFGRELI